MKNIVVINGSPKNESDSEKLAHKFVETLKLDDLAYNIQFFKLFQMDIKNFYFMKMTIKNNQDYFIHEYKVWKDRGWIKK